MRWLVRIGLVLVANAVALLFAALVFEHFTIETGSFFAAVAIFSLASLVLRPLIAWVVTKRVRPLLGVVGLVATFVILLLTDLLSDGIQIEGGWTWIASTVIVWLGGVAYQLVDGAILRKAAPARAAA